MVLQPKPVQKRYFSTQVKLQISVAKFKIQNTIFFYPMKLLQNFSYKFKIQDYRRYLNVSRNINYINTKQS